MARNSEQLLAYIREGRTMTQAEKLRLIVSLSVPSILAQISATVMFFIDAAMVGHLGEHATAAIGLVETTTWLMGGLGSAANIGFSVQVAHFIGANDFEAARRVLRQALVCCALWGMTLTTAAIAVHARLPYWLGGSPDIAGDASTYFLLIGICGLFFQMSGLAGSMLKSSGNMKVPSMLNIGMCVMDVVFNYLFIYIMELGVIGAALGTGLAELITAVLMLWFLLVRSPLALRGEEISRYEVRGARYENTSRYEVRGTRYENTSAAASSGEGNLVPRTSHLVPRKKSPRIKLPRIEYETVKTAFKIGAPMGLQHLLMGGAQIVSTIIVAPLGTVAIAANSLAITVESLCFMPGYGIAEAATTLVGQSVGAGQRLLTRSFANQSVALGIGVMTAMGVLMWIFAPELMAVMSPVDDIIAQGADALRIEAWAEPMFAASIVCNGVFIGAADTLRPAIMSLTSMWGVRLTLAALLAPLYGLRGVWTAMAIELSFRGAIFLARLLRGRWIKA